MRLEEVAQGHPVSKQKSQDQIQAKAYLFTLFYTGILPLFFILFSH